MGAGLGAGRLHESDPAEPVVGVLELAGVPKSGLDEQRDNAVAKVTGHSRASGHPGAYQAGQVTEGVGATAMRGVMSILAVGCRASEIDDSDLASRPQGPERVMREPDPALVIDVMQRQRRDYVVERGILGGDPVGVSLDESEGYAAAERFARGPAQSVFVRVKTGGPDVRMSRENGE